MQFNKHAGDYNRYCQWQNEVALQLKDFIFNQNLLEDFDELVDLGCGTGELSKLLRERYSNYPIILVDYTKEMLEQARLNLGNHYNYIQADIRDEKRYLNKEKKQIIVSNLAFQWLENKQVLTLRKLFHQMNSGSKIFISTLIYGTYKYYYQLLDDFGLQKAKIDFITKKRLLDFDFIRRFSFGTKILKEENILYFLKTLHFSGAIRQTDYTNIVKLRSLIKSCGDNSYFEQIKIAYLMVEK